jgi:Fur family ferric uptake transcriptional regulator
MSTQAAAKAFTGQGRRDTRQRRVLRRCLADLDAFVSAQRLHELLKEDAEKVGISTIYRTLQAMAEAGELDTIRTDDGETLYRQCDSHHHHHLVCRSCGLTVELDGPAVEEWIAKAPSDHGFTEVTHIVELFGRCKNCSNSNGARSDTIQS